LTLFCIRLQGTEHKPRFLKNKKNTVLIQGHTSGEEEEEEEEEKK
jgi:hypothetical protein